MKISIPTPCKENYKKFKSTANGGFCKNCATEVIDFTKMNKVEIQDYFLNVNGKVCGRLPQQHLDLKPLQTNKMKNGLLAASVSLFSLFFTKPSIAQQNKTQPVEQLIKISPKELANNKKAPKSEIAKSDTLAKIINGTIKITGTVVDGDYNEPLPGASIVQVNTQNGTIADIDGNFMLQLDTSKITDSFKLKVTYVGFPSKQISILPTEKNIELGAIVMTADMLIGEIVFVGGIGYKKFSLRRIWHKTKGFFRRIF